MVAGIPGTGVSGLFYILLTVLMPIREFYRLCKRRSSWRRWYQVFRQTANSFGVVGSIWLMGKFLVMIVQHLNVSGTQGLHTPKGFSVEIGLASACGALLALLLLVLTMGVLHLFIPMQKVKKTL